MRARYLMELTKNRLNARVWLDVDDEALFERCQNRFSNLHGFGGE
jgi:hypothetical protein